jgi:hypothetical protein
MKKCVIIVLAIAIIGIIIFIIYKSNSNDIKFSALYENFIAIKPLSGKELGDKIGGKVKFNIDQGIFNNFCAIRMSYAFNYAGYSFKFNEYGETSSGGDGKYYIFRVKNFKSFLDDKYKNKKEIYSDKSKFEGKKGVIVFEDCSFSDAFGHVDLFDGNEVVGKEYFNECNSLTLYKFK